jgi:hypothetical protein
MDREHVAAVLVRSVLEGGRLFSREERLALELLRPFERCRRAEVPVALEIRVTVRRARWRPRHLGSDTYGQCQGDQRRPKETSLHVHLPNAPILGPSRQVVNSRSSSPDCPEVVTAYSGLEGEPRTE